MTLTAELHRRPDHPSQVGNFEVLLPLGRGGMGEVFLARHRAIGRGERLAVLKRIRPEYESASRYREMFLDEARLAALLHHPNICQAYEFCLQDGNYWLAIEFIDGQNLFRVHEAARARGGAVPLDVALHVVICLCAALHHAHELCDPSGAPLGIVHRDVNPSNVMIARDGTVKLLDFGVAKAAGRRVDTTIAGALKGKIGYMSPEQCRGRSIDRRSDIFSLGILLYELTTASRLFDAETEVAILNKIVNEPIIPPTQLDAEIPRELEAIVLKALAFSVEDRYQLASQLGADCARLAAAHGNAPSAERAAQLIAELFDPSVSPLHAATDHLAHSATIVSVPSTDLLIEIAQPEVDATEVTAGEPSARWRNWLGLGLASAVAAIAAGIGLAFALSGSEQRLDAPRPEPAAPAPAPPAAPIELAPPPEETAATPAEPTPTADRQRSDEAASRRKLRRARRDRPRTDGDKEKEKEKEKARGFRKMIQRDWDSP